MMTLKYQREIAYITEKCKEYNADADRTHLNVVRTFAASHELPMELIFSDTKSQVIAFRIRANTYSVKNNTEQGCKLDKTPRECGGITDGCRSCGWWIAEEAKRKRRIHAGGLTGYPAHLEIKKGKEKE